MLTWNVQQLLEDRPVGRGQILLTIGDLSGPWEVKLHIPDRQTGHVLAAQQAHPERAFASFLPASDGPPAEFPGHARPVGNEE